MSKILILLLASAGVAHADCYMHSDTVSTTAAKIERITDQDQNVIPQIDHKLLCRVTFRALINNQWEDAEGESTGPETDSAQICAQALAAGKVNILRRIADFNVAAHQDMTCTDRPRITIRPSVAIGDQVLESEVAVHSQYPKFFPYRGNECRWFSETGTAQGIICHSPGEKTWKVVDKF
jgi:hypothetical protein